MQINKNKNPHTELSICMIQMHVVKNKDQNIENAIRLIRTAVKRHNCKMVVLPENFNMLFDKHLFMDCAEVIPTGTTCMRMSSLARELKIYLVCGSIVEQCDMDRKMLYNTCMVYSPTGTLIAKHRKIHLTDIDLDTDVKIREMDIIRHGDKLTTFDVDGIKIGLGIGFDLSFGELATLYRRDGCEVLIYPLMYPVDLGTMQEQLVRTRAIDNQMFVVGVSQARDDKHDLVCFGHSMCVDAKGRVLCRGYDREDILFCELDFTHVDLYRKQINLLQHKRKDVYDTLLL